jgi:hypothetical protein
MLCNWYYCVPLVALFATCAASFAQILRETNVTVQTFAGSGVRAVLDGVGQASAFYEIVSFNISPDGFLFASQDNGTLRRISPSGTVTSFQAPAYAYSVAATSSNRALVSFNQNIYEAIPTLSLWNGGSRGHQDATDFTLGAYGAMLSIDFSFDGLLWIADDENKLIRVIFPTGELRTIAGSGDRGFQDGSAESTSFWSLYDIAVNPTAADVVVSDDSRIRRLDLSSRSVTTLAGKEQGYTDGVVSMARFGLAPGICIGKNGDIFIADRNNHSIRRLRGRMVTTVAGGNRQGFQDGKGEISQFNFPDDIVEDSEGNLYVADSKNFRIRKITFNQPAPDPEAKLNLQMYPGLEIHGLAGRTYQIDVTPDLSAMTNWSPVSIIVLPEDRFIWFDNERPGPLTRYYRAVLIP